MCNICQPHVVEVVDLCSSPEQNATHFTAFETDPELLSVQPKKVYQNEQKTENKKAVTMSPPICSGQEDGTEGTIQPRKPFP